MPFFLVISAAFAAEHDGHTQGPSRFASAKTSDGRSVCAHTSLLEFPELFVGRRVSIVELTPADFPSPAVPTQPLSEATT